MPTREEMSRKIRQDLAARGVVPTDLAYDFVLDALEVMNNGIADLDDELADLASRLAWLAQAPTWINQRPLDVFDTFVNAKLAECAAALAAVRARWEEHQAQRQAASASVPER